MPQNTDNANPAGRRTSKHQVALWLVVFNYAQAGVGFLVSLWLAKRLGPAEYGILSYGIVVGGICAILAGFASERTLVRDLVHSSNRSAMMTASIVLRLAMAALILGGCLVWVSLDKSLGGKFWPVIFCSAWGILLALSPKAWLDCQYKMHISAGITFAEKLAYAISIVSLILNGFEGIGATLAAACLLATRALSITGTWLYASKSYSPVLTDVKKNAGYLASQNGLILGAAVANLLMTHANQLLLEHNNGTEKLAHYSVAYQITLLIQLLQSQFVRLLAPRMAKLTRPGEPTEHMRPHLLRYTLYSLAATAVIVLPVAAAAPWLIGLVDQRYLEAASPLRILCIWLLLYGPGLIINQFLLGLRLHKTFFAITLSAGATALACGQLLVPRYNGVGVALSLLLSHGASIAAQFATVWIMIGRLQTREASQTKLADSEDPSEHVV